MGGVTDGEQARLGAVLLDGRVRSFLARDPAGTVVEIALRVTLLQA